jgi:hypothetical protein
VLAALATASSLSFPAASVLFLSCCCAQYVDANSIMHEVGRRATTPDHFLRLLRGKLDQLFCSLVRPAQSLCICVDGPAAWAKVIEQRKRRRQAAAKNKPSASKGRRSATTQFNRNLLTPGCPFMDMLTRTLEQWCRERMQPGCCLAHCTSAVVSGSNTVGEGEHKMLAHMLANGAAAAQESGADPCSHCFISGDADLFLLSLVQGLSKRVTVVSEVDHRQQLLTIWSTERLGDAITRELLSPAGAAGAMPAAAAPSGLGGVTLLSEEERGLRRDFCLVSLFSGNDYLPGLACAVDTKLVYEAYLEQRRRPRFRAHVLVQSVPADALPTSLQPGGWAHASSGEHQLRAFAAECPARFEFNVPLLIALMDSVQNMESRQSSRDRASSTAGRADRPQQLTRKDEEVLAVTSGERGAQEAAVHGYLTGLLWVLELYHHGHCLDFGYIFERRLWTRGASPRQILQHAPTLAALPRSDGLKLHAPRSEQPRTCQLAACDAVTCTSGQAFCFSCCGIA